QEDRPHREIPAGQGVGRRADGAPLDPLLPGSGVRGDVSRGRAPPQQLRLAIRRGAARPGGGADKAPTPNPPRKRGSGMRGATVLSPPTLAGEGVRRAAADGWGVTAGSLRRGDPLAPAELPEAAVDPQFGQLFLRAVL